MSDRGSRGGLVATVSSDFERWCEVWELPVPASRGAKFRVWSSLLMGNLGLRAVLLYRISRALRARRIPYFPGAVSRLNTILYGLEIPPSVEIGPGFYVPHPVGTVVMTTEPIGANLSLISSITIGMRGDRKFPTIGTDVYIGTGARILGDVRLADGAKVGANAVVMCDVPAGCLAVGVPAVVKQPKLAAAQPVTVNDLPPGMDSD